MGKKKKRGQEDELSSRATKPRRGLPQVVVEVLSSSSSDHAAADGNASNGKDSVSSTTTIHHPKAKKKKMPLHSNNRPKARDSEQEQDSGDDEEEEEAETGGRRGRHECFSPVRVRRVIKGGAGWRTNQEALFLISAASARFLQVLVKDAYAERKKVPALNYNHISSAVSKKKRYEFLSDFVPQRISAKDALLEKAALEEEST